MAEVVGVCSLQKYSAVVVVGNGSGVEFGKGAGCINALQLLYELYQISFNAAR